MRKLAFITDEATQDLREAIAFAREYGLTGVELRSVDDTPIDRIPTETLKEYRHLLDEAGLTVCNLASSFFKCLPGEAEPELDKLRRLCDAADILGCDTIRGFAFFAGDTGPAITDEIIAAFSPALSLLKKRGKTLLLESDPSVNTHNHVLLADFLRRLDSDVVGAIYDPGNDIYDAHREIPYPHGYESIKPWLRHVHIKDARRDEKDEPYCVCIGTGWVDYPGLLAALKRDGYDGWFSLETHYRVGSVISEELMARPGGAAFTEGGMAATAESALALCRLMEEAGL